MLGLVPVVVGFVVLYAIVSGGGQSGRPDDSEPLFGATVSVRQGESLDGAVARVDDEIGRPQVVRVYSAGAPPSWDEVERRAGDAAVVVSFKFAPSEVLGGSHDQRLSDWFGAAPNDRDVFWVYFHEPEDNIDSGAFTAGGFRAAWAHIDALADGVENHRLNSALVLMCWTLDRASGRTWSDYIPSERTPDVLAWDCYNRAADRGEYTSPAKLLDRSVAISNRVGAEWALAEIGSELAEGDDGEGRARWLEALAVFARANDAAFVTYFHALQDGKYALLDSASQSAWRSIMAG